MYSATDRISSRIGPSSWNHRQSSVHPGRHWPDTWYRLEDDNHHGRQVRAYAGDQGAVVRERRTVLAGGEEAIGLRRESLRRLAALLGASSVLHVPGATWTPGKKDAR